MGINIYIAIPIMGLLAVIQAVVLPRFPIAGVTPQLLFLVALAWSLLRGPQEGLLWAFIAGIWVDLFSMAPIGVSSLAFMVAVGAAALVQKILPPRRLLSIILLAGLATLVYLAIYLILLTALGHGISANGLVELLPLLLLHILLIVPIYLLMQSLLRTFRPRPVEL
jgi:rod shape-determining protein MreD